MRILVISDIHANLAALEAVLKVAPPYDGVWCLGDTVGYGPQPNECLDRVRTLAPRVWLAGNHDRAVTGQLDIRDFNHDAAQAVRWTQSVLRPENDEFLTSLPESELKDGIAFAHGSPRHPVWEYILTERVAAENFPLFKTALCFVGHTHVPALFREHTARSVSVEALPEGEPVPLGPERMILNPGSVGQPRDGDSRAAFAVVDTEENTLTHLRAGYEIATTQEAMAAAHLPPRLIRRLEFGM